MISRVEWKQTWDYHVHCHYHATMQNLQATIVRVRWKWTQDHHHDHCHQHATMTHSHPMIARVGQTWTWGHQHNLCLQHSTMNNSQTMIARVEWTWSWDHQHYHCHQHATMHNSHPMIIIKGWAISTHPLVSHSNIQYGILPYLNMWKPKYKSFQVHVAHISHRKCRAIYSIY